MIHQYQLNGYKIVLEVDSGSVHVVDDLVYQIIALYDEKSKEAILEELSSSWPKAKILEAW